MLASIVPPPDQASGFTFVKHRVATRVRRHHIAVAVALAIALTHSAAHAQQNPQVERAAALFDEAEQFMSRRDWTAACSRLSESQKIDPQLGTQLHLAHCYEKQGKLASAWINFRAASELAAQRNASGKSEPREDVARRRAAALEPRLSTVTFSVANPERSGLSVEYDGEKLDHARWSGSFPVDPGPHRVRVTAPGREDWNHMFEVRGEAQRLSVAVPELAPRAANLAVAPEPHGDVVEASADSASHTTQLNPTRLAGWITGGAGIIGVGLGVAFAVDVRSKLDERDALCPKNACPSARDARRIEALNREARAGANRANVAFIAGGVAMATGLALVLFAPESNSEAPIALAIGVGSANLTVRAHGL
jgi:hypothetical protein